MQCRVFQSIAQGLVVVVVAGSFIEALSDDVPVQLADMPDTGAATAGVMTTTPPQEAHSLPSILASIKEAFETQLRVEHGQKINALVAFIFGILLLFSGEFVFTWLVVAAIYILAMIMGFIAVDDIWGLDNQNNISRFVGFEAGACSAYAAYRGIDGVKLAVGALLGALVAHQTQATWLMMGYTIFHTNKWLVVTWYSVFILGLMLVVRGKKYQKLLALASPLLGGALVSSALSWLTAVMAQHGWMTWLHKVLPGVQPAVGGAWIDFFLLLCSPAAKDVGVFAGSPYKITLFKKDYGMDKICGCTLWFVIFLVGSIFQYKAVARNTKKAKKEDKPPVTNTKKEGKKKAGFNQVKDGGLKEPILKDAV